jgi:hypothetical protein
MIVDTSNLFGVGSTTAQWMMIDPVQCLENPWEKEWKENNPGNDYPRGDLLVIENDEKLIIEEYFKSKGVNVLDVKSETYTERFGEPVSVCEACTCPQGYTLYIQTDITGLSILGVLGFSVVD